jgi:hypothetical protein
MNTNTFTPVNHDTFIKLANERAIPNHCELTTTFETFEDWIDNDQAEFLVELFVASGLDSPYNVLNHSVLKEAMETVSTLRFNALGDFYDYYLSTISMHNAGTNTNQLEPGPALDPEIKRQNDEDWNMIRAAMNAVMNGGPTTYKGQKIPGLYLPDEDEFLKAHPELQPYQQVKAVTTCTWWTGFYDDGAPESTGELDMDDIDVVQPGYEFEIMYMGHGRFHIFDAINHEGILYPQELGSIEDHESIDCDEKIEYLKHFKLV